MMQNPNRVFGKDELFERIWGLESLGDNATVTVHIRRIREKLNPIRQNHSILKRCGALDIELEYNNIDIY